MDLLRGVFTLGIGIMVLLQQTNLPGLNELANTQISTNYFLYFVLLLATFATGCAEVLRDNSAQTVLPAIVEKSQLEKANGRLWSAESVMNTFIGPPLGSFIIGFAIFLPFFINAGTFLLRQHCWQQFLEVLRRQRFQQLNKIRQIGEASLKRV